MGFPPIPPLAEGRRFPDARILSYAEEGLNIGVPSFDHARGSRSSRWGVDG